ncbi:MAG: right-handed parallel beta-helix repeat-containing protein, partial [Verrucomicrobia bacterium]|nr:right-handed parallel beta-helix repeat-containing protein [Verrucomicrobiota bacterium]
MPCKAATIVVSNTNASGAGSLQQAILDANAASGLDIIIFQIPGEGVQTISPAAALPAITDAVVLDGATQPGYVGIPLIELNGASAGAASDGLRLAAGNSTVRSLIINRFYGAGIHIQSPGGTNRIEGNFIGTDTSGAVSRGNGQAATRSGGVWVDGSSGNWIGGPYSTNRNLISGNGGSGIYVQNSSGNTIQGNLIGTTLSGLAALGNTANGIAVYNSSGNQLGGASTGARNVISGNTNSGVYLYGSATTGNSVLGNYIGASSAGTAAIPNVYDGITVDGAGGNTIGGTNAGAGNLVSGNSQGGIKLKGTGASGNLVQGNFIGTDAAGRVALGNTSSGITLLGCSTNLIGGTTAAARNLISGNKQAGVYMTTNSVGNLLQGNYIGVGIAGTNALGNAINGVSVDGAAFNRIGGATEGARNLISGNSNYGIEIYSATATSNVIQGNYIGSDIQGSAALPNKLCGIHILSSGNTIGGTLAGAGNLISGNTQDGVFLDGASASNNVVQGNFIGTMAGGTNGLGNGRAGIGVSGAPGNTVGGSVTNAGNVVSANATAGISLFGARATGNLIQGNKCGTDVTGYLRLGNALEGIYLESAPSNTIGGAVQGAGNLVGANGTRGIYLVSSPWNVIQGNTIGTAIDGISPLSHPFHGVECDANSSNTRIGGDVAAGNRMAFAQSIYAGVRIRDGSTNNAILSNIIFSNGAMGIDLGAYNLTPNVACGNAPATKANMGQNYPQLTEAVSGNGTSIRGTLNSKTNRSYLIQFFANPSCDAPSGHGEGQVYLGQTAVATSNSCDVGFDVTLPVEVPAGYVITSTATDSANNTSEFSTCVPVTVVTSAAPSITTQPQAQAACAGVAAAFSVQASGSTPLSYQWWFGNSPVAGATG